MKPKITTIISIFLLGFLYSQDCSCNNRMDPVCGDDGFTYPNRCIAQCFNVEIDYRGTCSEYNETNCPDGSLFCLGADFNEEDCYYCEIKRYGFNSNLTRTNDFLFTANALTSSYGSFQIDLSADMNRARVNSFKITISDLDEDTKKVIEAMQILAELDIPFNDDNSISFDFIDWYKYRRDNHQEQAPDRTAPERIKRYRD